MRLTFLFPLLAIVSAKNKINPNAVNLALETSLVFDGSNTQKDLSLIDGLQNFLEKLKGYLKLRELARFRAENRTEGIFTAFLKDFSRIIINYDNENLKNLTDILALVMEPYYYEGTTFQKLIKDEKLKSYIKDKIMDWADTDPQMLKYQMAVAVMSQAGTPLTEFGNHLNSLFSEKDSKKLKKYLKKFNKHENATEMHKLVKNALEFIIFHRYNKLDQPAKHDLMNAIKNVTDFLMRNDTPQFRSPKNDTRNDSINSASVNVRRSQINSLLPKKIVLHQNMELNVKAPEKEDNKDTEKHTTKQQKAQNWKKISNSSMEVKLDDKQYINLETKEHEVDTVILDSKHSGKKKASRRSKKNKKAAKETTRASNGTVKDNATIDVYKQIMAINIEGKEDTDTEHRRVMEHKTDERQPHAMALVQNSKNEANIATVVDVETAQNELNKTVLAKNETEGTVRRMGEIVQRGRGLPDVDIADLNTDTEELKMKIVMNPHNSVTIGFLDDTNENQETAKKNKDEVLKSDKEEYQNKISDGADKISSLLDNVIAMKLLGIH